MSKPRILVLTAAGRTGMPIALQLLDEGFPVTAFVHKADQVMVIECSTSAESM